VSPQPLKPFIKFHAGGTAFSARFERPVPHHVASQADVYLPTIGGHGHARVDDFEVPRLVRFKNAQSHVSGGYENEDTATSQVTTTIEGLNILDVITAGRITARLTSEHVRNAPEAHILAYGSVFENLRIGGYEFKIKLRHGLLQECKTYDELAKRVAPGGKSGKTTAAEDKVALCSLVEEIVTDFPGLSGDDKKKPLVKIPHFGTIHFAELLFMPGTKILTMMRLELGSPDGGTAVVAETAMDGPQFPPPH
jgi:hypothetical protein